VLIAAFSRSLRDPFVHARNAALLALAVTGDYFSEEDCAARILPSVCPCLIDKEKLVRDQAIKTMDIYMTKIKKAAAGMPDTVLPPPTTAEQGGPRMSTPQPESASSASWAGWAISSFTNKLSTAAGEIEANGATSQTAPQQEAKRPAPPTSSASALHRQALKSPPPSAPLSRTSSSGGAFGDSFFADPEPADDLDAWGDMDEGEENTDFQDAADDFASPPARSASSSTTTLPRREPSTASRTVSSTATPFDDAEPDFAGWLAAQQKKPAAGKGLPKGLSKPSGTVGAKKPATKPVASKPVAPKKIDLKPKDSNDDDGWGDGW
jgi:SCY1-like protein 1